MPLPENVPARTRSHPAPTPSRRCLARDEAPRPAGKRRARPEADRRRPTSPSQEHQFGAETWSHGDEQSEIAALCFARVEQVAEHEQDGSGGEVPDRAERFPGARERFGRQLQRFLERLEHAGSARVTDEMADFLPRDALRGEEGVDVLADAGAHEMGNLRRRSEEHTSELQSPCNLVCRLLLEEKNSDTIRDSD